MDNIRKKYNISSNDVNILSSEDINLTPATGQNINVEQDTSIILGSNNTEKITANSNNEITINSAEDINLIPTAGKDVNIPNEIGLIFGSNDSEKIEVYDTNNLSLEADNDILFDTLNVSFSTNNTISGNMIVTDELISLGEIFIEFFLTIPPTLILLFLISLSNLISEGDLK